VQWRLPFDVTKSVEAALANVVGVCEGGRGGAVWCDAMREHSVSLSVRSAGSVLAWWGKRSGDGMDGRMVAAKRAKRACLPWDSMHVQGPEKRTTDKNPVQRQKNEWAAGLHAFTEERNQRGRTLAAVPGKGGSRHCLVG
jgi:hypothetical protein